MSWIYQRRVKYYETDRMGVVHHTNYLRFLEDARMDWLNDHVMNYRQMEKELNIVIPAVSASGKFIAFLRYDDLFTVEVKLIEYTSVRMKFSYRVLNAETNELCYTGETEHCFVHADGYKPMILKRFCPELHEKFMHALANQEN